MATMFPSEIKYFTIPGEEKVYNFLHVAGRPDSMFLAWRSPDFEDHDISTNSVTISTIHSAKRLDFAHVLLLGLDRLAGNNEYAKKLSYVGINTPPRKPYPVYSKRNRFHNQIALQKMTAMALPDFNFKILWERHDSGFN